MTHKFKIGDNVRLTDTEYQKFVNNFDGSRHFTQDIPANNAWKVQNVIVGRDGIFYSVMARTKDNQTFYDMFTTEKLELA